jgi:uncharacterized membrane protein
MKAVMEQISVGFELAGVGAILVGFLYAAARALSRRARCSEQTAYKAFRATFGRAVLLGLELLVAADLIRTVAVDPTLQNLAILAILVAIRTLLSWALEVEIEGRWPWKRGPK